MMKTLQKVDIEGTYLNILNTYARITQQTFSVVKTESSVQFSSVTQSCLTATP